MKEKEKIELEVLSSSDVNQKKCFHNYGFIYDEALDMFFANNKAFINNYSSTDTDNIKATTWYQVLQNDGFILEFGLPAPERSSVSDDWIIPFDKIGLYIVNFLEVIDKCCPHPKTLIKK